MPESNGTYNCSLLFFLLVIIFLWWLLSVSVYFL